MRSYTDQAEQRRKERGIPSIFSRVVFAVGVLALATTAAPSQDAGKAPKDGAPADKAKTDPAKNKRGLILNGKGALPGYTLLSPIMNKKAFLLDIEGRVVRTWESESSGSLSAYLLENGHLLRHARLSPQPFGDGAGAGGHIQEFSWDGELVWDFRFASVKQLAHHDICRMPNGNVLLIVWEKKTAKEAIEAGRRPETVGSGSLLPDCIMEVQPTGKTTGKVVWEWHVWDHLIQDHDKTKSNYGDVGAHPELIDINFGEGAIASIVAKKEEIEKLKAIGYIGSTSPGGKPAPVRPDWLHCNAVAYNAELDQVMISSPEFNEIWIIDHSTSTAEAATHKGGRYGRGGDLLYRYGNPRAYRAGGVKDQKLFYQHNAHWIPKGYPGEGHVLVFNNGRRRIGGAHSSVDELVLPVTPDGHYEYTLGKAYGPDKPAWSYVAPKKTDFNAEFISGAHRLPNGNTFICAGPSGTIFEVTPKMETVWKYMNPVKPDAPPPPAEGPPALVEFVSPFLRDMLKVDEDQSKKFLAVQKDLEGKVKALLTEEQKKLASKPAPMMGPPPASAQPIVILAAPLRSRLKLTDEQKKKAESLQKDAEGELDKLLTAEQRGKLKEMRDNFVNLWGGGGPGGGPPALGNAVFRSYRYAADYPGFAGKKLTPGRSLEESPPADSAKTPKGN